MKIPFKEFSEVKLIIGSLNSANDFQDIKPSIQAAAVSIVDTIGEYMYNKMINHYLSTAYKSPLTKDYAETDIDIDRLNNLVLAVQRPMIYFAYERYSAYADLSTGNDGRKMIVDDNRKNPFEWMIANYDNALIRDANQNMDMLLEYIEKIFTDWKDQPEYLVSKALFLNTAKQFNAIYPIDNSRYFFSALIPFISRFEKKEILPRLSKPVFDTLKANIADKTLSEEDITTIELIQYILVPLVMAEAVNKFAIKVFPNSVVQQFRAQSYSLNANVQAATSVRIAIVEQFQKQAAGAMLDLEAYIKSKTQTIVNEIDYETRFEGKKFFRF